MLPSVLLSPLFISRIKLIQCVIPKEREGSGRSSRDAEVPGCVILYPEEC
jgi:hypothetical protein